MTKRDPSHETRRIMDQFGEPSRIPLLNISEGDVGVVMGFPLAGLFLASILDQQWLTLPLLVVGLVLGVACVYAAPAQLNAWTWVTDIGRHMFLRPRVTHCEPDDGGETTEGGAISYTPFQPDEQTKDLTNIERAWSGAGVIERSDGTIEAFIELHPANMDFGMGDDWAAVQRAAREFANGELDFSLTFHATTQSFPAHELVKQLEDRLTDDDITANETFHALVTEYRNRRPTDLADARQIRYFLGVEVTEFDVHRRYSQEPTPAARLATFPILGILATPFVTRETYSETERQRRMIEALDERIHTVQTGLVEAVPGWSATRLSTLELFVLNQAFWNGESPGSEPVDQLLSTDATGNHFEEGA